MRLNPFFGPNSNTDCNKRKKGTYQRIISKERRVPTYTPRALDEMAKGLPIAVGNDWRRIRDLHISLSSVGHRNVFYASFFFFRTRERVTSYYL